MNFSRRNISIVSVVSCARPTLPTVLQQSRGTLFELNRRPQSPEHRTPGFISDLSPNFSADGATTDQSPKLGVCVSRTCFKIDSTSLVVVQGDKSFSQVCRKIRAQIRNKPMYPSSTTSSRLRRFSAENFKRLKQVQQRTYV